VAKVEKTISLLVVDDEDVVRTVLRLILVRAGYEVSEAENGEDALLKVREEKPDLMILDVMMPGMDGFAVCEQIRSDPETADLPIIMLSARTDSRSRNRSKSVGATKYLTKPQTPEQLLFHIGEILANLDR
jgi:CheY-like chemotaxis protein